MKEFIEKLIGRLEEQKAKRIRWLGMPDMQCEGYTEAIEIVNQLAEEYNNDFCEWKEDKNFNWFFKSPHEGIGIVKEESGLFNFCPYCGKKIKVAPYQSKGE